MNQLTNEQNFNVAKYTLDSSILNLENGISWVKQMSATATSFEQLEQTKVYLESVMNIVQNNLNKISFDSKKKQIIK